MRRDPIRFAIRMRPNCDMPSKLRINMGREYPIKYGVKVQDQGNVHGDSMPKLLEYRNEIRHRAYQNLQMTIALHGASHLAEGPLPGSFLDRPCASRSRDIYCLGGSFIRALIELVHL